MLSGSRSLTVRAKASYAAREPPSSRLAGRVAGRRVQRLEDLRVVRVGAARLAVAELARVGQLGGGPGPEGFVVEGQPLAVEHLRSDPAEVASDARELLAQPRGVEAHRLHELRPAVGRGRGHAHHRHRLDEARAQALEVGRLPRPRAQAAEPGPDRVRAHRHEERAVLDVPHPGLGHQADAVAQPDLHQRVVEPARRAQRGHGRPRAVHGPVGQNDHCGAAGQVDALRDDVLEGQLEPLRPPRRVEGEVERRDLLARLQGGHLLEGEDALFQDEDRPARPAVRPETRPVAQRHLRLEDPRVADGVDGRARLLREAELEVVLEAAGKSIEHGRGRRVVPHRAHRRLAGARRGPRAARPRPPASCRRRAAGGGGPPPGGPARRAPAPPPRAGAARGSAARRRAGAPRPSAARRRS